MYHGGISLIGVSGAVAELVNSSSGIGYGSCNCAFFSILEIPFEMTAYEVGNCSEDRK